MGFTFLLTNNFSFEQNLDQSLKIKSILLDQTKLNFFLNSATVCLKAFFRFKKVNYYKRRMTRLSKVKNSLNSTFLDTNKFLNSQFHLFRTKLNKWKINNLNKDVKLVGIKIFIKKFKRFKPIIFVRRLDLFSDFIKLSSLLIKGKITTKTYISLLSQIFTNLLNKKHGQFLSFLKAIFKYLLKSKRTRIKGIKIWLSGKLKKKPRASTIKAFAGAVPCQQIKSNVEYVKMAAYNRYGAFGFKLWINWI